MKKKRFSDAQILSTMKQAEGGVPVSELCCEHGMSSAAFYQWRAMYGGMDASMLSDLRETHAGLKRLKRMSVDLSMRNDLLKKALGKSDAAISTAGDGQDSRCHTGCQHGAGLPDVGDQRDLLSL